MNPKTRGEAETEITQVIITLRLNNSAAQGKAMRRLKIEQAGCKVDRHISHGMREMAVLFSKGDLSCLTTR